MLPYYDSFDEWLDHVDPTQKEIKSARTLRFYYTSYTRLFQIQMEAFDRETDSNYLAPLLLMPSVSEVRINVPLKGRGFDYELGY